MSKKEDEKKIQLQNKKEYKQQTKKVIRIKKEDIKKARQERRDK